MTEPLIRQFFGHINERQLHEAAEMLAADAMFEYPSRTPTPRDREGFLRFAEMWLRAFPDSQLAVGHIDRRGDTICEVDVIASGTHSGDFDLGPYGLFKATGTPVTLRFRQLLEVRGGKITYSSLSFDIHDFVRQLVTVDETRLMEGLERIRRLADELAATADDARGRLDVVDRLGRELDAARRIIRPYFYR